MCTTYVSQLHLSEALKKDQGRNLTFVKCCLPVGIALGVLHFLFYSIFTNLNKIYTVIPLFEYVK